MPLSAGGDVYWAKVNAAGGVAGKYKVELVKEDNAYSNEQTKAQVHEDQERRRDVLPDPRHAADQDGAADLKTDDIVASPASLDAAWVREPNLLPIGSTYQIQFINAASWLVENEGSRTSRSVRWRSSPSTARPASRASTYAAKELGFTVAATASVQGHAGEDYTGQIAAAAGRPSARPCSSPRCRRTPGPSSASPPRRGSRRAGSASPPPGSAGWRPARSSRRCCRSTSTGHQRARRGVTRRSRA